MALSGSYDYVTTRDLIIARALRIIGALGQGETPIAAAVTEAAYTLNDIFKEWQADGLHIWTRSSSALTPVASTQGYTIGVGGSLNVAAPTKLLEVYRRTGTGSDTLDVPMTKYTRQQWDAIPNKLLEGTPIAWLYQPPAATASNASGYLRLWPIPDTNFVTTNSGSIILTYTLPLQDFDAASNNPDLPSYLVNALVWALADQLAYEYGVPDNRAGMIGKKAQLHKAIALSYDQEEGSLFLLPNAHWGDDG